MGLLILYSLSRFVKIERPTSEQIKRGNSELIFILEDISHSEIEEDVHAARNIIIYLDEHQPTHLMWDSIMLMLMKQLVFLIL